MCHISSGGQTIGFVFYFPIFVVCPLCCKDVPSFDSNLSICVIFCQVDKLLALFFIFHCLYVCPLYCKDVLSFDSSLSIYGTEYFSMCHCARFSQIRSYTNTHMFLMDELLYMLYVLHYSLNRSSSLIL